MGNLYLNSGTGSDANNGTTKALAKATLAGIHAVAAAGDRVHVASTHAETQATSLVLTGPGTTAAPLEVVSVDWSTGEPPVTPLAGAAITVTSNVTMTLRGVNYYEGITFTAASGGSSTLGMLIGDGGSAGNIITYRDCNLRTASTNAAYRFSLGAVGAINPAFLLLDNPVFRFGNVSQRITMAGGQTRINNIALDGSTFPTLLFGFQVQRIVDVVIAGGDLSNLSSSFNVIEGGGVNACAGKFVMYGVKMPSGWSGNLRASADTIPGFRSEMHACHDADGMFYERADDAYGQAREELTLVRSGGRTIPNSMSGGTNPQPMSIKMDGTGRLGKFPLAPFIYELEPIWNTTVGSSVTITVPILMDSASEWDDTDVVLRVHYPSATGTTQYAQTRSAPASVISSRTGLTTKFGNSSGWTTTGMTNAKQRQLQVSVTPREVGFIKVEVFLYRADVVYVDQPSV